MSHYTDEPLIEIVGIEASGRGRSCEAHKVCGSALQLDTTVRFRTIQILNGKFFIAPLLVTVFSCFSPSLFFFASRWRRGRNGDWGLLGDRRCRQVPRWLPSQALCQAWTQIRWSCRSGRGVPSSLGKSFATTTFPSQARCLHGGFVARCLDSY